MTSIKAILAAGIAAAALPAAAEITLFERPGFEGRSFTSQGATPNLRRENFDDRASSAIVRGGRYEVCEERRFRGNCVVLRPGQYPSLRAMGLNNEISSVRPVSRNARIEERRFAPPPPVQYDYRRRRDERIFQADVVGVRAVYGTRSEERCWIERERLAGSEANAPAAIAGAVIGGILGHQIGSGRGNDAATIGGAIAGAAIGANIQGDRPVTTYTRDVRRCERVPTARPAYWDVTYRWKGEYRYVQMTEPPGRTIAVNHRGEPRA